MIRIICDPKGFDGLVIVPDVGSFAPGVYDVTEAEADRLLQSPHFRREEATPAEPQAAPTPPNPAEEFEIPG